MSNFKEKYFSNRLDGFPKDNRRYQYGLREIQTLKILQKVSGLSIIKNGFVAADIGCGDRFLEKPISDEGMHYIGFDIQDLNLEKDPFKINDNTLDVILNYSVIEHLSDPSNFLQESYRCLKPGGGSSLLKRLTGKKVTVIFLMTIRTLNPTHRNHCLEFYWTLVMLRLLISQIFVAKATGHIQININMIWHQCDPLKGRFLIGFLRC